MTAELIVLLGEPRPKDKSAIDELKHYKGLDGKFEEWEAIVSICKQIAAKMIETGGDDVFS